MQLLGLQRSGVAALLLHFSTRLGLLHLPLLFL
jgi:hypothetical protein